MCRRHSRRQTGLHAGFVTKEGKPENHLIILSQRWHKSPLIFHERKKTLFLFYNHSMQEKYLERISRFEKHLAAVCEVLQKRAINFPFSKNGF
jgi:hypothetical protein